MLILQIGNKTLIEFLNRFFIQQLTSLLVEILYNMMKSNQKINISKCIFIDVCRVVIEYRKDKYKIKLTFFEY